MTRLREITIKVCEDCILRRGPCREPECVGSKGLGVERAGKCCECSEDGAVHVVERGTPDERRYCEACWNAGVQHEPLPMLNTWTLTKGCA